MRFNIVIVVKIGGNLPSLLCGRCLPSVSHFLVHFLFFLSYPPTHSMYCAWTLCSRPGAIEGPQGCAEQAASKGSIPNWQHGIRFKRFSKSTSGEQKNRHCSVSLCSFIFSSFAQVIHHCVVVPF